MPRRRSRPASVLAPSRLTALPYDIISTIAQFLEPRSLHHLTLTCRQLYHDTFHLLDISHHLDHTKWYLCVWERMGSHQWFLNRLEKAAPGYFFCPKCQKLCKWDPDWTADGPSENPLERCWWNFTACRVWNDGLRINPTLARIVMNRHLWGPSHGLPLQVLDMDLQSDLGNGVVRNESRRARIINDRLYVHNTCVLWQKYGNAGDLLWRLKNESLRLCEHHSYYEIRELQFKRGSDLFVPCHRAMAGCSSCMTDFVTSIKWTGSEQGWVIRIEIYHRLGRCRHISQLREIVGWDRQILKERTKYLKQSTWVRASKLSVRKDWLAHGGLGEEGDKDIEGPDWAPKKTLPGAPRHVCTA